ncbi:Murein L,D-transpeptidase YcbB/YkuD [Pseudovibrio denitrificans]|uniref:Murein L,D-transpeptidase YcbB/YkuD n=1 Tax=Pseudovibrio denitrificans TaxID=258256 RepID=A0A1I6Y2D6_9HYPH|nr:L,D-transpeptidase family protein [Pseudovibrio denitrificans]SFT44730.1 Murein L,D-transpeptidase YcbB/YkuD [Pseudovibrio denitrificans]
MSHKSICATILAASLIGMISPSSATSNATSSERLIDPLNFNEDPAALPDLPAPEDLSPPVIEPLVMPESELQAPPLSGPAGQVAKPTGTELSELEQTIRDLIFSEADIQKAGFSPKQIDALAEAYALRKFRPVWFEDQSLTPLANHLVTEIRKAPAHGLDPQAYGVRQLASILAVMEASNATATLHEIAVVELQLTRAFATYGAHIAGGVVRPTKVLKNVFISPQVPKLNDMLTQMEETRSLAQFFDGLEPEAPSYDILKDQLARYNAALTSDYPVYIEDGPSIRPGDTGGRVAQLEKRLQAEGYAPYYSGYTGTSEVEVPPTFYNDDMVELVKDFQKRHGLTVDGVVGKKTRAALNASLEDRRNQILVNLERMRWDDPLPSGRYVKVNVAEQMVRVMEGTDVLYETRSVVGKPRNATPLFSDTFEYAEINPTWGVPWSIATNEYLPKLRKNASALSGTGINVYKNGKRVDPTAINWSNVSKRKFGYQLRQKAGRKNALGAVKYMFPNKHNIYLHDTPSKRLFNKDQRAFSHGCIRVQDPFTFGEVLLSGSGHSRAKMEKLRARGKTVRLKLTETVPVHLRYYTAFAGVDGELQFREDIYKQDKAILEALLTSQDAFKMKMASTY